MNGEGWAPGALRQELAALPPWQRGAAMLSELCTSAAKALGLPAQEVDGQRSWVDLGFDSLRAIDYRSALAQALDLELRSTLLFDEPTPARLAAHLLERLGFAAPVPAPAPAPAPRPVAAEPIAIVGAACRVPGADDLESFWQLLVERRDAVVPFGRDRFDVDAFYDPDPNKPGTMYVREAGLLRDHAGFDAAFFGISPREAVMIDPQHRLLLEVGWHALEHANLPPAALAGQRVGVYVGVRASEYFDSQTARSPLDANAHYPTGDALSTAAGRLAYVFGFRGPCFALDTACSGSLVALHVAVRALRARECDVALAGGANSVFDPVSIIGLCRARMLSPDGRCKSFAKAADGYGRGEGAGMVVCKRLADAEAAGDRVLAIVHGTAINQDGRSGGLTVPHGPAQSAVIQDALTDAGLSPEAIDYLEAHGTGTQLGDPIEVQALDAVFGARSRPLPIGAVKTNIGHLEAAAGMAGLLKAVLALRARTVPANLHFDEPSPHIDWAHSITRVVAAPTPLSAQGPLYAGVSSFGFSGTNAHVVVGVPAAARETPAARPPGRGPWLLPLQAHDQAALRALAGAHAEALVRPGADLVAHCHAAAVGRSALPCRAAFVAGDAAALAAALRAFAAGDDTAAVAVGTAPAQPPRVAFLFPGQGAQRVGMGRALHAEEPVFAAALERTAAALAGELPLRELLFDAPAAQLDRTDATQPALCAYQTALLALARSVGLVPAAVLGHSVGDFAAAVAAGVLEATDAVRLCAARGRLMVERCAPGGMLVVLAPVARFADALAAEPALAVAVHNAETNVVVGGPPDALARFAQRLQERGVATRRLPVSHAFHTAATEPMLQPFAAVVRGVALTAPQLPMVDGTTGAFATGRVATAAYWTQHVREPVQCQRGLATLADSGASLWLEFAATPTLAALAVDYRARGIHAVAAQSPANTGRAGWLAALAALWVRGVHVDCAAANHGRGPARADLPLYPFQRRRCWVERRVPNPSERPAAHPLLGEGVDSSLLAPGQTCWRGRLAADQPAWLVDHRVGGQVLLPAAAMLEIALAAERAAGASLPFVVRNVAFVEPRPLGDVAVLGETVRSASGGATTFAWKSKAEAGGWRTHCEGQLGGRAAAAGRVDLPALAARCAEPLASAAVYAHAAALQLQYGPAFRGIERVQRGEREVLATLRVPAGADDLLCVLHPVLLDAAFQAVVAALPTARTPWLPIGIESLVVHRQGVREAQCHAQVRAEVGAGASRIADITLFDAHGDVVAAVVGLQLVPADPGRLLAAGSGRELLHHHAFEPAPAAGLGPWPSRVAFVALSGAPAGWVTALVAALPKGHAQGGPIAGLPALLAAGRLDHVVFVAPAAAANGVAAIEGATVALQEALAALRCLVRVPHTIRPWLLTHGALAAGPVPAGDVPVAAVLVGVWRTLALEHRAARPVVLDLDPALPAAAAAQHAAVVVGELRGLGDEPEVAHRAGQRLVTRLRPGAAPADQLVLPREPFRIRTRAYGAGEQLAAVPLVRQAPRAGEVEVALLAAGLNFKDVLHARGLLASFAASRGIAQAVDQPLAYEGCGVVTAVGEGVVTPRVGETVLVVGRDCLATHVVVPAALAVALPAGVEAIAAAGMPTVFATVLHGLEGLAAVQPGETVLVHAAAGGVGQAAWQWLRARGARLLATASPGKQELLRARGIEVVGDSRRGGFAAAVRAATGGRGVDVVLNTANGATVAESLAALREGGRFVELGKLGVWTAEQVAAVRPDVHFAQFDLGDLAQAVTPVAAWLRAIVQQLAAGTFTPVPATVLPAAAVRQAFAHLAKGQHVGKVVVRLPVAAATTARSWLVTGASGGIAPAIVDALVDSGVRHVALLARGPIPAPWLLALRERGVTVLPLAADVTDRAALAEALRQLRAALPPLAGIVHAAGALADGVLAQLDPPVAAAAAQPKIAGALWLDELMADDPLEAFVLVGSMAGTLGNPGQAAYAGANTFLDAFAAWRVGRGRPAVSIACGPWQGPGMAGRLDDGKRQRLQQLGVGFLPAALAARWLVQQSRSASCALLPVRWATWLPSLGENVPPPWRDLHKVPVANAAPEPAAMPELAALAPAPRAAALRDLVRRHVAAVLGFGAAERFDGERTFREHGLDSLLAIDAKDRLERLLGLELPATLLFDHPDLERLVAHLLVLRFPPASATAPAGAALEELGTDELARQLAAELRPEGSR